MKLRNRFLDLFLVVVAVVLVGTHAATAEAGTALAPSSTYTVNSTLDTNDGVCDATNCHPARRRLTRRMPMRMPTRFNFRWASGTPAIVISAAGLPTISQPVTINGNTGGATTRRTERRCNAVGGRWLENYRRQHDHYVISSSIALATMALKSTPMAAIPFRVAILVSARIA